MRILLQKLAINMLTIYWSSRSKWFFPDCNNRSVVSATTLQCDASVNLDAEIQKNPTAVCMVLITGYDLKHPVLHKLKETQPDVIESLSILAQQIALVIRGECPLTDWDTSMQEKEVAYDRVSSAYSPYISDPIKGLVRAKGNQHLLVSQKADYLKLYFMLGCRYPSAYIRAWIYLTGVIGMPDMSIGFGLFLLVKTLLHCSHCQE